MALKKNQKFPPLSLSDRVEHIPEALSIYINQIVYDMRRRGRDVITLSLGEAFFDIPLFDFKRLDLDKCYHYSDSQGIPELRTKITDFYRVHYGAIVDPDDELLITVGSKPAIFMAMQATLNPGDEVLIHEPAWLSYQEQARLVGATPHFIPYDCSAVEFEPFYTPKTRMLVINNPNNPAGRFYSAEDLRVMYSQCRQRGIYILVDEAYSDFLIDQPFVSMATVVPDKQGVIVVNSLSKNMGISGWRVGYVITHPRLLAALLKLNQHLITCGPTILLHYLAYYFDKITSITLPQVRDVVEKREKVAEMLDRLGLKRLEGSATFYFFVDIADFPGSSLDFALHLLVDHDIAVVPGSAYGASTERFVRVSVGTESEERIWEALIIMRDVIDAPGFEPAKLSRSLAALKIKPFVASPPDISVPTRRNPRRQRKRLKTSSGARI
jgi:aspartate/methionine/tyrosine aminotransferase